MNTLLPSDCISVIYSHSPLHTAIQLQCACARFYKLFWEWASLQGYDDCSQCRELGVTYKTPQEWLRVTSTSTCGRCEWNAHKKCHCWSACYHCTRYLPAGWGYTIGPRRCMIVCALKCAKCKKGASAKNISEFIVYHGIENSTAWYMFLCCDFPSDAYPPGFSLNIGVLSYILLHLRGTTTWTSTLKGYDVEKANKYHSQLLKRFAAADPHHPLLAVVNALRSNS